MIKTYIERAPNTRKRVFINRSIIFRRDKGVCAICGSHSEKEWDKDHIIPLSEGGPDHVDNIRTLCIPCHNLETRHLWGRLAGRRREAELLQIEALKREFKTWREVDGLLLFGD